MRSTVAVKVLTKLERVLTWRDDLAPVRAAMFLAFCFFCLERI